MDKIEANGRTVEEAVQAAALELGVSVDDVEYEVVDHGNKGFLGLGQTPAVVNAWVSKDRPAPRPRPAREVEPEAAPVVEEPEEEIEEPVAQAAAPEKPEEVRETMEIEEPVAQQRAPVAPSEEEGDFAGIVLSTLSDILGAMKLDAKPVRRSSDGDEVTFEIVGSDTSLLTDRQGQTLDALQYLVGIIANRTMPTRKRVILDAGGYRDRHRDLLEKKAHEYADAVKREGKEAVLEPQSARDRRIIHLALADDAEVYTYSEGEGGDRHVVISPKK